MSVFDASQLMFNNPSFYNNVSTQSLRFDTTNGTVLSKTPSASNLKTWTWAAWVKRSKLGVERAIWSVGASSVDFALYFHTTDQLRIWTTGGTGVYYTSRLFRDVGSWYHIAITSNNVSPYIRLYINGVLDTQTPIYDNRTSTPGSGNLSVNTNAIHRIGAWYNGSLQYFDGYLADINHIDGTAVGDTSGILDEFIQIKNGVCIPKSYSGSYGTNGYRLEFKQTGTGTASASTIGADTSGNNNHYTSTNLSAHDCVPDSPENNFCTYNSLDAKGNDNTFSEGNLKVVVAAQNTDEQTTATFAVSSGKWYWEHRLVSSTTNAGYLKIGLRDVTHANAWTVRGTDGETQDAAGSTATASVSYTTGNVIGVYLDMDNGKWYVSVDGTLQNSANLTNGTGFLHNNLTGTIHPFILNASSGGTHTGIGNFGQDSTFAGLESAGGYSDAKGNGDFHSSVTSPYLSLCSANLPDTTLSPNQLEQADDHFNTLLYTGNSTNNRAITGLGFQPDWTWIKKRSGAQEHVLFDSSRGATKRLFTNLTNAESNEATSLKAFTSSGFTLGTHSSVNDNTETFVAWNWKANGGTTSSNTDGSITSTVQANTTAGFSIVTYTGTGSAITVGHGLGNKPEMIIAKRRDSTSGFPIYHQDLTSASYYIQLNVTTAQGTGNNVWNQTDPTSTVFTVGTDMSVSSGTYVAYVFSEIEGYSKFGTYTGNGAVDGTFIFTGFQPAWVMFKKTSAADDWVIIDSTRDVDNVASQTLYANGNFAEDSNVTNRSVDFLSNGFKLRSSGTYINLSGGTFIYMAFAENPFKFANAK